MKIIINEVAYDVPDGIIDAMLYDVWQNIHELYLKQDETLRFGEKVISRHILQKLEQQTNSLGAEVMAQILQITGMDFRPAKRADPNIHLMGLMLRFLREALVKYVVITLGTQDTGDPVAHHIAFSIAGEGEGGRQVAYRWDDGHGQDDLHEETPQELGAPVSDEQNLHTGYELQRRL